MNLSPLSWQSLSLAHTFQLTGEQVNFFDFQPKAQQALSLFKSQEMGSLLVVKSEVLPEFLDELSIQLSIENSQPVIVRTEFKASHLFGYTLFLEKENCIETIEGAIQQAKNGILVLRLNTLLHDLKQWDKLKQALLFGFYEQNAVNHVPEALPAIQSPFKLLLVGSREDISMLAAYDGDLYQFAQYTEVDSFLNVDEESLNQWGDYVQAYAQKFTQRNLSEPALQQLLQHYIRESESQAMISISPTKLKNQLLGFAKFYPNSTAFTEVNGYFETQEQQASTLNEYALQDILNNQVYIETDDEEIGQINGLSVIEFEGVPYAFGEPLRISCNVQYGDGEITDIERKVELGGNIHSKGILIAQSCLANLLELPTQLPFSASLAFEQSYGEVDGDSSSLAIFCVLVSSLAKVALPQSIAVTGSIDQFGNVLSVGGVNQKIEGFFEVCDARRLTGKQGVIIPASCVSYLSLKPSVLAAVKAEKFQIWAVESVFEAVEILLKNAFYAEDRRETSDKPALFDLIHQGIEQSSSHDVEHKLWHKIFPWWKSH
ncbi:AAA family ATPase [Haemophilus parahaemolyticus]|uniref:AAA family ATPase n=1 Tax=Haemophilus parahaemolyticus TaxID=735 RepID=UPI0028F0CB3C|nr:AAA family ATPase [Haemophilus parahaemolyticus]